MGKSRKLFAVIVVGLIVVGKAVASSDLSYDGYDVCGYGKIVSLGLMTSSKNEDIATVELETMGQKNSAYRKLRGKLVISMSKEGIGPDPQQIFSLKFAALAQALANGMPIRILHLDWVGGVKCDDKIGRFDIRVCRAGLPCWRGDKELAD